MISKELNGENIIGKPLLVDEYMRIGTIVRKDVALSRYGKAYMEALKNIQADCKKEEKQWRKVSFVKEVAEEV